MVDEKLPTMGEHLAAAYTKQAAKYAEEAAEYAELADDYSGDDADHPKHTQHLSLIHISEPTRPY